MGIFSRDESRIVGGTGLHPRGGDGSLEIGYWVAVDAIGQGIATEVTAVLTRVGIEIVGLDRVDLQIEPSNERSVNVARKLGFTHEGTLRRRVPRAKASRGRTRWCSRCCARSSPVRRACSYRYDAYDALGTQVA